MRVPSALATILICALFFAAIGTSLGYLLGTLVPGYYQSVFRSGREPGFDPVSVGVGTGLTQGTAGGVVVGLVVVALLSWREIRQRRVEAPAGAAGSAKAAWRVFLVTAGSLLLLFLLSTAFFLGLLGGERSAYHRQFLREREGIVPVLSADPAFAAVQVHEYSGGGLYLTGEVPTAEDLDRLRASVVQTLGERRVREGLLGVSVKR